MKAIARRGRAPLTRQSGLPLYHQIHHLLRHRILNGEYPAGSITMNAWPR